MYYLKPVLIFGGTGSLGRTLVKRFIKTGPVVVFSRDEAKQHKMQQEFSGIINYEIGDIRNYDSVERAIRNWNPSTIINAAAMKQVPACENFPYEALLTNTVGTYNVVKAVERLHYSPGGGQIGSLKVLSISTDKACKPVNSYGMTKALQERIHLNGKYATYNCVRYGNVLESTGSVIPVFKKMIAEGKPLKITDEKMTRFLLSLDEAVNLIFRALKDNEGGKIFIPKVRSAKITDLANIITPPHSKLPPIVTGIRPGEKIDEILISEEELHRTEDMGDIFVIHDINTKKKFDDVKIEYSSAHCIMPRDELEAFLEQHNVI